MKKLLSSLCFGKYYIEIIQKVYFPVCFQVIAAYFNLWQKRKRRSRDFIPNQNLMFFSELLKKGTDFLSFSLSLWYDKHTPNVSPQRNLLFFIFHGKRPFPYPGKGLLPFRTVCHIPWQTKSQGRLPVPWD